MTIADDTQDRADTRLGRGANGSPSRNHNARAILSLVRAENRSGKELADALGVSAQTASVITRQLEAAKLIKKSDPRKGKVGKPQVPWALNPNGAFGVGLRIGRRSADFVLMDLKGTVRLQDKLRYPVPTPETVEGFFRRNFDASLDTLGANATRLSGFGVAMPFALWNWVEGFEPAPEALQAWRGYSIAEAISGVSDLPVSVSNDATMACQGESLFGAGEGLTEFAYIHIGALLGGGIVLNGRVYEGPNGNAGDFAAIPVGGKRLSAKASLAQLEARLAEDIGEPVSLGARPELWQDHPHEVAQWLRQTSMAIAEATVGLRAVLDIPSIIIDGGMPDTIKGDLVAQVIEHQNDLDQRGLYPAEIIAGRLGDTAGALGAANLPLLNAHFLEGTRFI